MLCKGCVVFCWVGCGECGRGFGRVKGSVDFVWSNHIFLVGMAVLVVVRCVGLRVKREWSCRLRMLQLWCLVMLVPGDLQCICWRVLVRVPLPVGLPFSCSWVWICGCCIVCTVCVPWCNLLWIWVLCWGC